MRAYILASQCQDVGSHRVCLPHPITPPCDIFLNPSIIHPSEILALRSWMLVVDIMSGCVWIVRTGINSKAGTRIGCLTLCLPPTSKISMPRCRLSSSMPPPPYNPAMRHVQKDVAWRGYRVGEAYSMRAYILALRSWMLVVDMSYSGNSDPKQLHHINKHPIRVPALELIPVLTIHY
jgi:hypothetical protein